MKALEIGGVADHVHILVSVPATMALSKAVQLIKGGFIALDQGELSEHGRLRMAGRIRSIYRERIATRSVRDYIRQQPEHHRTKTFAEEYKAFLERHRIEFDERYLLG